MSPPRPKPSVGWGCWRAALLPSAALILTGIFSLPDGAEECLGPPQGAGEGELSAMHRAGSGRAGSGSPARGSAAGARHVPLAGRRRKNPRPAPHTCGVGRDEDGFLQLAWLFCNAGHKGPRLQPSPAATPALPCRPWLVGAPNPQVSSLVNSRKAENSNYCFQRGCQRQSFPQSIVAAFLRGYCS